MQKHQFRRWCVCVCAGNGVFFFKFNFFDWTVVVVVVNTIINVVHPIIWASNLPTLLMGDQTLSVSIEEERLEMFSFSLKLIWVSCVHRPLFMLYIESKFKRIWY